MSSVTEAVPELRRRIGPVSVAVFGSVARGDFNRWSDVDVLVVAETLPVDPLERAALLLESFAPGIEPRGYTRHEYASLRRTRNRQFGSVLDEAVTIADDLAILRDARRAIGEEEPAADQVASE